LNQRTHVPPLLPASVLEVVQSSTLQLGGRFVRLSCVVRLAGYTTLTVLTTLVLAPLPPLPAGDPCVLWAAPGSPGQEQVPSAVGTGKVTWEGALEPLCLHETACVFGPRYQTAKRMFLQRLILSLRPN
jgi:hypothetical protein